MDSSAEARRIDLYSAQVPALTRPKKLVGLLSVKQIVFPDFYSQAFVDGETHEDQTDAQLAIGGIKTRLEKVKNIAVAEAVKRGRRFFVQPQDEKPEPAALQGDAGHFFVERQQGRDVKDAVAAVLAPSRLVQLDEPRKRPGALFLGRHRFEADLKPLLQVFKTPLEIIAMFGAERGQIGIPRVTAQIDKRADAA